MSIKKVEKDRNQSHLYGGNKSGLILSRNSKDIRDVFHLVLNGF